jgi:hypothetical protein
MDKPKVAYTPSALKKVEKRPLLNGKAQSQNYKTGRVYVFGKDNAQCLDQNDSGDDDTVFEMGKIRARKGKNGQEEKPKSDLQKVNIIHRPVFPNDTLSKFALQYGCTVGYIDICISFLAIVELMFLCLIEETNDSLDVSNDS